MNARSPLQTKPTSSFTPVSSRLLQRKCACGGSAGLTGKCSECKSKRLTLQRRATNQAEPDEVPPIVHEVLQSPGQQLDRDTRNFMESRFGHDFSQVRVHTDTKAAESAQAVNALAYTVGRDVVFKREEYQPETIKGKFLLAHELTHVLQQGNRDSTPVRLGKDNDSNEIEANAVSTDILTSPKSVPRISSLGSAPPEPGTVQGGWPLVAAAVTGIGAALYAIWAYRCLKPLEIPMYNETFGDPTARAGSFRLWYYNQTGNPVPNNVWDAFGHCWIACASTQRCGAFTANLAGSAREFYREYIDSDPHDSYKQDLNNQKFGRDIAKFLPSYSNCATGCRNAALGGLDLSAPKASFWDPARGDYAAAGESPTDEALASVVPENPTTEPEV